MGIEWLTYLHSYVPWQFVKQIHTRDGIERRIFKRQPFHRRLHVPHVRPVLTQQLLSLREVEGGQVEDGRLEGGVIIQYEGDEAARPSGHVEH
jgi:hypothetical protein